MAYGCLIPTDVALSVRELAVEIQLSAAKSPMTLLRMALLRVSVILQEGKEEKMKEFSRTLILCPYTGCWVGFEAAI